MRSKYRSQRNRGASPASPSLISSIQWVIDPSSGPVSAMQPSLRGNPGWQTPGKHRRADYRAYRAEGERASQVISARQVEPGPHSATLQKKLATVGGFGRPFLIGG